MQKKHLTKYKPIYDLKKNCQKKTGKERTFPNLTRASTKKPIANIMLNCERLNISLKVGNKA